MRSLECKNIKNVYKAIVYCIDWNIFTLKNKINVCIFPYLFLFVRNILISSKYL